MPATNERAIFGGVVEIDSHDLEPPKPLDESKTPLEIDVVSLDWKLPFIYPSESCASVKPLWLKIGIPIRFSLPSATVMNLFNAFFAAVVGFALFLHVWWAAIVGLLASVLIGLTGVACRGGDRDSG